MSGPLLLDTSAVFVDLFGSQDHKDELAALRTSLGPSGISPYVRREAEYVLHSGYGAIFDVLGDVPKGQRLTLHKIWDQVRERIDRNPAPGVRLVAGKVMSCHESRYKPDDIVDVNEVRQDLRGQYRGAIGRLSGPNLEVLRAEARDVSTCCLWSDSPLEPEPGGRPCGGCRLSAAVQDREFLALAQAVAEAPEFEESNFDEPKVLRRVLPELLSADLEGRLRTVAENPNGFGDLLVLWEVPDSSTLLATDRIFRELVRHARQDVQAWIARRIRRPAPEGTTAEIQYWLPRSKRMKSVPAQVRDYNAGGMCILVEEVFDKSKAVDVHCPDLYASPRRAQTALRDPLPDPETGKIRVHLRFSGRKGSGELDQPSE